MINTLEGFSGRQLGAIRAVVLEHGTGVVTRKAMEVACRARVDGTKCEYPPATIFKNEAMKLHVKIGDVDHEIKGTFQIPWKALGLFKSAEEKALREQFQAADVAALGVIKDSLKARLKSAADAEAKRIAKNTPIIPAVTPTPAPAPVAAQGKGKKTAAATVAPKATGKKATAKKSKVATAGATEPDNKVSENGPSEDVTVS